MHNVSFLVCVRCQGCHNLENFLSHSLKFTCYAKIRQQSVPLLLKNQSLPYSTKKHALSDYENQKKKQFEELEKEFDRKLDLDRLSPAEKTIHFVHADALKKGHFTYDDPFTSERVLTRLRHFLKGKCCGKSCRHCIYEHSEVVDEKKKEQAIFNSSFWIYEEAEDSASDVAEHEVLNYGRGPYPKKYAARAHTAFINIDSSGKT